MDPSSSNSHNDNIVHTEGYDEHLFVSKPAEYLRCGICALVLNNAIQILDCGHKFCRICFQRLKLSVNQTSKPLQCPIDRKAVDLTRVFEDIALNRLVGCLEIRCHHADNGCEWVGELSELHSHSVKCRYQPVCNQKQVQHDEEVLKTVQKMSERIDRCENLIEEKEKEISHLKFTIGEMKTKHDLQAETIGQMKNEILEKQQTHEQHYKGLETKLTEALNNIALLNNKVEEVETENKTLQHEIEKIKQRELPKSIMVEKRKVMNTKAGNTKPSIVMKPQSERDSENVMIMQHNRIRFKSGHLFAIVHLPDGVVKRGMKAFYEVVVLRTNDDDHLTIGWATKDYLASDEFDDACCMYTGYFGTAGSYKNSVPVQPYGYPLNGGESNDVIGVALDMVNGQSLFGFNGKWNHPMGVAFSDMDTKEELCPFITYSDGEVQVNFKEESFVFGPPDDSFVDFFQ